MILATIDELRAVSPHRWDGAVLGGVALDGMGWDGWWSVEWERDEMR